MGLISLSQARAIIEPGFGTCDPVKLTRAVNLIRGHMFGWFQEVGLFLDATECFCVQTFPTVCNDCSEYYQGVTLPRDMQQVEAMWFGDFPVGLQSSWREYQVGMAPECACGLQKFDVAGVFSTAADIDPRSPQKVKVKAFESADVGKRIVVRGTAATGQPFSQEFSLTTDVQETGQALKSIQRQGGIVKAQTVGRVLLTDENARVLGIYDPDETVPAYRRIKITGIPSGVGAVNIRASRRYFPLYGDDDVVETDNEVAFDSMARYLRLQQKSDQTGEDQLAMKNHYATAMKMMVGEKARDTGRATKAEIAIATPSFGRSALHRTGGRRW